MAQILKADTEVKVRIGPFVDVGDGFTPQTDIALSGNEAELLKHNGVGTVDISGNTWAAVTSCRGWYDLTLTTTDTNTEGLLTVVVQDDSDCLPVFAHFMVVNANVYDSLYGTAAADYLQVDTIQVTGTGQTANDNGADINAILVDTAVIGALGVGLTAIPWNSDWDAEVESEVTDSLVAHNLDHLCLTVTAAADMTTEVADNTILSRILANGDTSAFVPSTDGLQLIRDKQTDIETDTAVIGALGAGLTDLGGMSTGMKAEIEAECTDSLVAHNLDHLALTATAAADMTTEVADGTILSRMLSNGDTSAFVPSTDGLQLIRDKQTDIETDTAVIGALGAGLTDLGGMSTGMKAEVEAECTDAIEADGLDHLVATSVTGTDVADDSIIAFMVAKGATADFDDYANTSDSMQAIRDKQTEIEADTQDLQTQVGTAGAGLTDLGGMSTGMKAEVESECDDSLVSINLDHSITITGTVSDASPAAGNFDTDLTSATNDWYNGMVLLFIDNALSGLARRINDYTGASKNVDLENAFPSAPANGDAFVLLDMEMLSGAGPTAAQVADQVWDEAAADHVTGGSFGAQCGTDIDAILVDTAEIGAAGAGLTDVGGFSTTAKGQINTEVDGALDTAIPGSPTADSINERVVAIDALTEASGSGDLAAIKVQTDDQPAGFKKASTWTAFPFPMVLSSDHYTPADGKTVTCQISKDGGAFASLAGSVTEIANGWYEVDFTSTENNAEFIAFKATATACDQTDVLIKTSV